MEAAEDSLAVHHANTKALYRRALALKEMGDAEGAVASLETASHLDPNDKVFTLIRANKQSYQNSEGTYTPPFKDETKASDEK